VLAAAEALGAAGTADGTTALLVAAGASAADRSVLPQPATSKLTAQWITAIFFMGMVPWGALSGPTGGRALDRAGAQEGGMLDFERRTLHAYPVSLASGVDSERQLEPLPLDNRKATLLEGPPRVDFASGGRVLQRLHGNR